MAKNSINNPLGAFDLDTLHEVRKEALNPKPERWVPPGLSAQRARAAAAKAKAENRTLLAALTRESDEKKDDLTSKIKLPEGLVGNGRMAAVEAHLDGRVEPASAQYAAARADMPPPPLLVRQVAMSVDPDSTPDSTPKDQARIAREMGQKVAAGASSPNPLASSNKPKKVRFDFETNLRSDITKSMRSAAAELDKARASAVRSARLPASGRTTP